MQPRPTTVAVGSGLAGSGMVGFRRLPGHDLGDQKPGDLKEDIDPDVTAGEAPAEVVHDNHSHGDGAQPVDLGTVGLGMPAKTNEGEEEEAS